jgi:zinc/manganese transport system permease protein
MWAGLALAYAAPAMPPSFAIIAVATAAYLAAFAAARLRRARRVALQPAAPAVR